MRRKIKRTAAALLLCIAVCSAQAPDWVTNGGTSSRYSHIEFATGFGAASVGRHTDRPAADRLAVETAKRNLSEKISVSISSKITSAKQEDRSQYSEYINASTQSISSIHVEGLDVLRYFDGNNGISYAFVCASREGLRRTYERECAELRKELLTHLNAARRLKKSDDRPEAIAEYCACYGTFEKLKNAESILAGIRLELDRTTQKMDEVTKIGETCMGEVRDEMESLLERPIASLDDAAWRLLYTLKEQTGTEVRFVSVVPFVYQETRFTSAFARYTSKLIESQMYRIVRWEPAGTTLRTDSQERGGDQARFILSGSYWEQRGDLKLLAILRRVQDGSVVAGTEVEIPKSVVDAIRLELKPRNLDDALRDQREFSTEEVLGGGLMADLWTDKGREDIIFTKGEHTRLYIRTNMPCYVRLIYHLAGKQRALLLDNYFIDASKVNHVFQLPPEFEVDAPFGAEVLQASVQTEEFSPLRTLSADGYDIIEDDLNAVLFATRGLKKIKQGVLKAEVRLAITTMEN
jgi:hypothetical protein